MQTVRDILTDLWTQAGGEPAMLEAVRLTGEEPVLPSSFRVVAAAQAAVAAAGLAAAHLWRLRGGLPQSVTVDMRHAAIECRSERYLTVDDKPPPPAWDAIAGVYKTGDDRFVRLHTNFPHHRDSICKLLDCKPEREAVRSFARRVEPTGIPVPALEHDPTLPAALLAGAWACGLRSRTQLAATIVSARYPLMLSAAVHEPEGAFRGYPIDLPHFDYHPPEDGESP